jgi:hypothetical protein
MKNSFPGLMLILAFAGFSSCKSHDTAAPKVDSLSKNPNSSLAGQLYLFAPEYDSTNFVAKGDCDCCAANAVFLNDSVFLYIDYCDEGCSYFKGTYRMQSEILEMNFDSLTVDKLYPEYDGKDSVGNLSPEYTYNTVMGKADMRIYKKGEYKGRVVFTGMHEFGAIDTGKTAADMMNGVRAEGIWDRLIGKTKVVNPHSPAAGMPDLLGIWAGAGDQNAVFVIQESSMFYTDSSREYRYKLENDSMKIKYADHEGSFAIKMNGPDTLILDGSKKQVFHRFTN